MKVCCSPFASCCWTAGVISGAIVAAGVLPAAPPELPQAVEQDSRVQAEGQGWRLDQAEITDPSLPRVLLIGDSILNGYRAAVIRAFSGRANVDAWVNPYHQSEHVNRLLAAVLARGPYDVVHFNLGLHGWQKGRIKPGTFQPLTRAYVEVITTALPEAKLIWASSTPVTVRGEPETLDPEINATIVEHNRMAAEVMRRLDVPVNDFYAVLAGRLDLAAGDSFHWKRPAYDLLAERVVAAVEAALAE